jgi:hypothetical protein
MFICAECEVKRAISLVSGQTRSCPRFSIKGKAWNTQRERKKVIAWDRRTRQQLTGYIYAATTPSWMNSGLPRDGRKQVGKRIGHVQVVLFC